MEIELRGVGGRRLQAAFYITYGGVLMLRCDEVGQSAACLELWLRRCR